MNECSFCGGSLHTKILPFYDYRWGSETYRFENVTALVCAACGEIFFEGSVSQAMNHLASNKPVPKGFAQVPVLELPLDLAVK